MVVPLGMMVLGVIGVVGFRMAAASGLEREMAALRARGLPTNPEEADRWYAAVPAEENAALKILEAYDKHVEPKAGNDPSVFSWREVHPGEPLRDDIAGAAEEYVKRNSEALELLHAAAKLKGSRYPVDLSAGANIQIGHLARVRRMGQLLRWEAMVKANGGDAEGARESLRSSLAMAESLKDEPIFISDLVRMACMTLHLQALEFSVNAVGFDVATLREMEAALGEAEASSKKAIHRVMVGERAIYQRSLQEFSYNDYAKVIAIMGGPPGYDTLPEPIQRILFNARRGMGMHASDMAFYSRYMAEMERITELGFLEMLRESKRLNDNVEAEVTEHPVRYLLSGLTLPSLDRGVEKEALLVARLRCARAALSLERSRRGTGKLPGVVLADWLTDPVDDEFLEFDYPKKGGFRVWARAASELANEGRARNSTNWQDVAFTVVK